MAHIEKRRRRWYATLAVPEDVRGIIGKRRYVQSLQTEVIATAERRAARLVAGWKLEIDSARKKLNGHPTDPVAEEAVFWRDALRKAKSEDERAAIRDQIEGIADGLWQPAARRRGILEERGLPPEGLPELEDAKRFYDFATGKVIRTADYIEAWTTNGIQHVQPKTRDLKRLAVRRFCDAFPTVDMVTKKDVRRWALDMMREDGMSFATVQRTLSDCRGFWRYLQTTDIVPEDLSPFDRLDLKAAGNGGKRSAKGSPRDMRLPFASKDVPRLLQAAQERDDQNLAYLIALGMWTGCRIEELCALPVAKVTLDGSDGDLIEIEDAKTAAGWRTVPVHPKLRPTLERLVEDSGDGYVISGLTLNKYGDRSNAIGKRFGRLKTELGFGRQHVFHSIRKTVVTILENAGVAEGVVADIVGHEKPTMTYGLYSGGSTVKTMLTAIKKLDYPTKP